MQTQYSIQRRYARHPIRVPLAVRPQNGNPKFLSKVGDISEGGVSFSSPWRISDGSSIEIELPVNDTRFELTGTVVSCIPHPGGNSFRVGLSFVEPGMNFRMKLAEQVLRIGELQRDLTRERGTEVSQEEAARVWVEQYAATFADLYPAA